METLGTGGICCLGWQASWMKRAKAEMAIATMDNHKGIVNLT